MVMATLGTGIGGGVVLGGKIIAGVHGAGGEIGHMVLNPEETEACGCGNYGCAEQYCSANGSVRLAKRYLAAHEDATPLRDLADLRCKDLFDAGDNGDAVALAILDQYYDLLGRFLANICCTIDPEVIVLGGGVSKTGQPVADGAAKYFRKYAFHACRKTKIVLATLGNDAGAYGAFKLALDAFKN
jgi:glucokinase